MEVSTAASLALVLFPGGSLRIRHVGGKLFLQFVIHPLNSGQSLVALFALRRPVAEIPRHTEKVLRSLALFFNEQCQLLFLIGCERHICIGQCLSHLVFQLINRISLGQLPKSRYCPET